MCSFMLVTDYFLFPKAGITPGSLVIDPFVGSGSLIVAAAQFGARVLGSDIDYLVTML